MENRKPKKKRYFNDVYSDDGIQSDNKFSKKNDKNSDAEIVKGKKKTQARKGTVGRAATTAEPATKKEENTTKRNYSL